MRLWWVLLGCWVLLPAALAQEALYGKQPPPGAAFVRVMNVLPEPVVVRSGASDWPFGTAATGRVSAFTVVERGQTLSVDAGQVHARFAPEPGSHSTLVLLRDTAGAATMMTVADDPAFNQARARLAFYNLVPGCAEATLALEPGGQAVFDRVGFGQTRSRSVSPVHADLAASCGGAPVATMTLDGMAIGESYSAWLTSEAGVAALWLSKDEVAPYKAPR